MARCSRAQIAAQIKRQQQLDKLRCKRPLTRKEREEANIIADRAYYREYRAKLRDQSRQIDMRLQQAAQS